MTSLYHNFVGIDISKNDFVVAIHGENKTITYPNDSIGWQNFAQENTKVLSKAFVVLETTGGYEMGILEYLVEHKIVVHRADTRKVKNFIRSFGKYGKTDSIDAKAIAYYGYERHSQLAIYQLRKAIEGKLKGLSERRADLTQMLVQEKNRLKSPSNKKFTIGINKIIKLLEEEIAMIDAEINQSIGRDPEFSAKKEAMMKTVGIGEKTANSLLGLLPEIGTLDRKQIASLAAVAPHPKQSGQKTFYTRTVGGRRSIRPILFLAALAASKSRSHLADFYNTLITKGKKPMVALVALMRRIIVIANAKVRDAIHQLDSIKNLNHVFF